MDLDRLLEPIEGDSPSGVELRYEPQFDAIERLLDLAAKANRLTEDGRINEGAPSPDWSQVYDACLDLAETGRDLRLLVRIVRALYQLEGFPGLLRGLGIISDSLETYWESLHPDLRDRPEPAAACLPRTNALKQLENDENGLLGDLKYSPAFEKRPPGPIYGADLAASVWTNHDVVSNAPSGLNKGELDALIARHAAIVRPVTGATRALAVEEPERAQALSSDIAASEAAIARLVQTFNKKGGFAGTGGLSLNELAGFLAQCRQAIDDAIKEMAAEQGAGSQTKEAAMADAPTHNPGNSAAAAPPPTAVPAPGTIGSRADVEATLDRIVDFYEQTEPSSPIPFLVKRIRKMVPMDFAELMAEIAPGGVKDFNALAGLVEDNSPAARRRRAADNNE